MCWVGFSVNLLLIRIGPVGSLTQSLAPISSLDMGSPIPKCGHHCLMRAQIKNAVADDSFTDIRTSFPGFQC